jgi:hypothetical protein
VQLDHPNQGTGWLGGYAGDLDAEMAAPETGSRFRRNEPIGPLWTIREIVQTIAVPSG